jgi:hypothetical protein
MDMKNIVGSYVETDEYKREVEKHGFRYSPITRSLFLSYPFVPVRFSHYAVRVGLYTVAGSPISKIESIQYYKKAGGYAKVTKPGRAFQEYVENIINIGMMKARPRSFLA